MKAKRSRDKSQPLYMIGTVSEMLGMHPQTLRGYDRKGILSPKRSDGNTRLYSEEDIASILSPPKHKLSQILELVEKAKKSR
jgi:predicted site-specific integrase-resolvase